MPKLILYIRTFCLYILPIAFVLSAITSGHWDVSYTYENKKYTSVHVNGFPFPSRGMFQPVQFYNSGDQSYSYFFTALNGFIHLILAGFLFRFCIKRYTYEKYYWRILLPFLYLFFGTFIFLDNYGIFGIKYMWFSDFKIIRYHLWFL